MNVDRRRRVVTIVLFAFAAATVLALLAFVFIGPTSSAWITDDAEWTWVDVEAYTENLHMLKLAKAGDEQIGKGGPAGKLQELVETTLRELGVADDDRRVVAAKFRMKARRWREGPMTTGGSVLIPASRFEFLGPGYLFDGWVVRVVSP